MSGISLSQSSNRMQIFSILGRLRQRLASEYHIKASRPNPKRAWTRNHWVSILLIADLAIKARKVGKPVAWGGEGAILSGRQGEVRMDC